MFCTHCGTNIPQGAKFCPSCGAPVTQAGGTPAQGAPPKPQENVNLRKGAQGAPDFAQRQAQAAPRPGYSPSQQTTTGPAQAQSRPQGAPGPGYAPTQQATAGPAHIQSGPQGAPGPGHGPSQRATAGPAHVQSGPQGTSGPGYAQSGPQQGPGYAQGQPYGAYGPGYAQGAPGYGPGQYIADDAQMAQVIGPSAPYYLEEFHKVQAGQATRFNLAAFFLSGYFLLYRKCMNLFKKRFLIPYIILLVSMLFTSAQVFSGIFSAVGGIWTLVESIMSGIHFNAEYMVECQNKLVSGNQAEWGVSWGCALILVGIFAAVWVIAVIIAVTAVTSLYYW